MEKQKTTVPKWFWAIAVFFLLWNLMGVSSFIQQVLMSDEAMAALPEAEQDLYNSYPLWTIIAFAIAVFQGTLGSIGLLMRKSWAIFAFIFSLFAIIPQMGYSLFYTNAREVYGPGTEVMPVMVIIIGAFLVWFSVFAIKKSWLK